MADHPFDDIELPMLFAEADSGSNRSQKRHFGLNGTSLALLLLGAYSIAANELASIQTLLPQQTDERKWARFVKDAETAMSREHTLWRAARSDQGR